MTPGFVFQLALVLWRKGYAGPWLMRGLWCCAEKGHFIDGYELLEGIHR